MKKTSFGNTEALATIAISKASLGRTCPPNTKTAADHLCEADMPKEDKHKILQNWAKRSDKAEKKVIKRPTKAMKRPASAKAKDIFKKELKKAVDNAMKKSWPRLMKAIKKPPTEMKSPKMTKELSSSKATRAAPSTSVGHSPQMLQEMPSTSASNTMRSSRAPSRPSRWRAGFASRARILNSEEWSSMS